MNRLKSKETTEMLCLREIHVSFSKKNVHFHLYVITVNQF